jgi:hypothetical protein
LKHLNSAMAKWPNGTATEKDGGHDGKTNRRKWNRHHSLTHSLTHCTGCLRSTEVLCACVLVWTLSHFPPRSAGDGPLLVPGDRRRTVISTAPSMLPAACADTKYRLQKEEIPGLPLWRFLVPPPCGQNRQPEGLHAGAGAGAGAGGGRTVLYGKVCTVR